MMRHYKLLLLYGFLFATGINTALAQEQTTDSIPAKRNLVQKVIDIFTEFDTTYISPNYYNFEAMVQNTNNFEYFYLRNPEGQELKFSPKPQLKIGPYFGWRWIFLGYTFTPYETSGNTQSQQFNFSLYTSPLGFDLIWRKVGDNFKLKSAKGFDPDIVNRYKGMDFEGLNIVQKGVNAYYIFNHRHFSYPAAYAQSTVQRKSCGSWIAGFSFMHHEVSFDHTCLPKEIEEEMANELKMDNVRYDSYSLSAGYSYNWVFSRNWLLNVSLTPAIGYNYIHGQTEEGNELMHELNFWQRFSRRNFSFNGIARAGLVWNNNKYYGGASFIANYDTYFDTHYNTASLVASLNIYFGFNFHKRKQYR